jgi:hypothetical protein
LAKNFTRKEKIEMRKVAAAMLFACMLVLFGTARPSAPSTVAAQGAAQATAAPFTETWTSTYIAQQDFERGYMFWVSTTRNIWVLIKANSGDTQGEWRVYEDTFQDGEPEIDATLQAPVEGQYQPRRGFGKQWRDPATGLKDAIGWGITPEFAVTTPLGYIAEQHRYLLLTLGRQIFLLYEATPGQPGGRWELAGQLVQGNAFAATQMPSTAGAPAATQAETTDASDNLGSVINPTATP